ncbi:peptide chain release factor N(5)-glutamine methyltransferase [Roseococcus sp. SDR]|uniref:peptide chain release factor N(5)-glutamine methyltransferase n=1 Tax=Roseococcus sp. SDR TaxID=2835532 RepID=UPI001BD0A4DC|nr:peptide chain release factor N(5)-glutamine methyltransferase [Roseococcus sp. SDR]MBS7790449.1 peptide chain release factor N(5)-glutamine methyltransferase [Roseococcus sp. SDR]MBV1845763.1 peptide chain release factor N(5)-glutamine methyltransferase [Roseococcus sp. SDR]
MTCEPGESVGAFLCQAGQMLRAAAIENPRLEARLLLAHAMSSTTEALLRDPRAAVPPEAVARFRTALDQRLARLPMARILGHAGFWTLDLEVGPETLIPRADSETLIEAVLESGIAPRRILDLGTGTGCLLLAALAEFPAAWGLGLDLRPEAAALAARNAVRNGLSGQAAFVAGDWASAVAGRFDLVLSNPPYIASTAIPGLMPEVAEHEPSSALDGGPDGLDAYRRIIADLPRLLVPGGLAVLELGEGQGMAVSALAGDQGLEVLGLKPDLGGIGRALILKFSEKPVGEAASCV